MIVLVLVFVVTQICQVFCIDKTEEELLQELKIYSDLSSLLSVFKNDTNPLSHQILDTFKRDCWFSGRSTMTRDSLIKPVIVIEGNHKSSRDVVVAGLAEMLNARYISHPSPCIHRFHKLLEKGSLLRRCFYLLSIYAGSFYAKSRLNKPIIFNGYWTEQLAFSLTHVYSPGQLPPINSNIFDFPRELLQPDLIFYLNFPDKLIYSHVTTKSPLTWKPRILEVFKHLQARYPVVIMDVKPYFKLTTEDIHRYIHKHLYNKIFAIRNATRTADVRKN